MTEPRPARRSQRSVQTCTNCARRKIRCSKTLPCTTCVRLNKAASCQREEVAVVTRRSLQPNPTPSSASPTERTEAENNQITPSSYVPAATTILQVQDANPQINDQILEQLLASLSSPELRLTNEAAATLEFLTHGRRNVLNQFIGRETVPVTPASTVQGWDIVFSIEDARRILKLHEGHLVWMHNVVHMPTFLNEFEENVLRMDCEKSWVALYYALLSQTLHHIDSDCLPQVSEKESRVLFDKSIETLYQAGFMDHHRLTSVQTIFSSAIRIAQCLNLHRLGSDPAISSGNPQDTVDREVKKRVWWFLVRYDWLQIPFQNTCQIDMYQFDTPMPVNCHDDMRRMVTDGNINAQPTENYTITTWTRCLHQLSVLMWHHQDRKTRTHSPTDISVRYEEVVRADNELKELYSSWPQGFRDTNIIPSDGPSRDGLPTELMPAMLLMSTAQKGYVKWGKEFIAKEEQTSSIARRGVRLLTALMDLEQSLQFSVDIEADIGDTIRSVALADEDSAEVEGYQIVFPYGQELWESLM
ncbi:hypothetical protein NW768_011842 [Fusarium equiseti]|uniref:Zn(2)-C6 fungal-type domain-containing protein n=1 Tax=Fusarium equiseti TaxID=61235 RepID=A0ABQ8QWZ5_FUSEQ|nr:hypothetical protein NW768_011842 [Fusarium equiseti]